MAVESRRVRGLTAGAAVLAATLAVGACEGDNLFSEVPVSQTRPTIEMTVAETAPISSTLDVVLRARSEAGLDSVALTWSGAIEGEDSFQFDPGDVDELFTTQIELVGASAEPLNIQARAWDVGGRVSTTATATVQVTTP